MSEPNRSARVIGRNHGLNANEMAFLLEQQGFLEGAPGARGLTVKGRQYGTVEDVFYGGGGSPKAYEKVTYSPELEAVLDFSDEAKQRARDAARQRADTLRAERAAQDAAAFPDLADDAIDEGSSVPPLHVEIVTALAGAALTVAYFRYGPRLKRLWSDNAVPRLAQIVNRSGGDQPA